jgi:hypothetical protein
MREVPVADYAGMTVAEILLLKRAAIKNAPLEEGSPGWDDIMDLTWEEIVKRQKRREPGFKTFHKLLKDTRFDK